MPHLAQHRYAVKNIREQAFLDRMKNQVPRKSVEIAKPRAKEPLMRVQVVRCRTNYFALLGIAAGINFTPIAHC